MLPYGISKSDGAEMKVRSLGLDHHDDFDSRKSAHLYEINDHELLLINLYSDAEGGAIASSFLSSCCRVGISSPIIKPHSRHPCCNSNLTLVGIDKTSQERDSWMVAFLWFGLC